MVLGWAQAPSHALARGLAPVRARCLPPLSMQATCGGESGLSTKNCPRGEQSIYLQLPLTESQHLPATALAHACACAAA
jgi:hypothetical protein